MKTLLALLLSSALCFADAVSHAEIAESGSPAGGSGERSEPEGVPHAEPAEGAESAAPGGDAIQHSAFSTQNSPLSATVSLSDGSILKGSLRPRFLPAVSPSLGRVRIDLRAVERIDFIPPDSPAGSSAGGARSGRREGASGAAEPGREATSPSLIAFRNGDTLTAAISPKHDRFVLATLLGPLRIPLSAVRSITFNPSTPSTLLYHCTFDDTWSVEHPAAGPSGRFLGGSFVSGKFGRALRVEADTPAFESKLPKGFLGPEGCLEFWAKIEGDDLRYVEGGDPLFVSLYDERRSITLLQFAANNGFARGGLGGAMAGWSFGTIPHSGWSMEYRKILGDNWADWHHYAMSWKADGFGDGSFVKVFVDGNPQPVLGGVDDEKVPARLADYGNHAYDLGIPWHASSTDRRRSKKPFLVDDLKIWSVAKTDFACSRSDSPIPHSAFRTQHSELLYHCTFDDAQSIERPAAGPSGTFLGGTFEEGKAGNALRVRKGLSSAIVHFEKGVLQPRGMIEFWAKIENDRETFGDGGDPRFFMMETAPGSETVFQLAANDGCGRGGLSIYHQGLSAASEDHCLGPARYDSVVPGATKGWHHYALVWDENGVPGPDGPVALAAFIDGRRIPLHGDTGLAKAPRMAARFRDNPATFFFSLNPELDRVFNNKSDFLIDEFKIWSAPKPPFRPM